MCGRYILTTAEEELIAEFDLIRAEFIENRYNIAPSQLVPVIRAAEGTTQRRLDLLRWGLIPSWAKDIAFGNKTINARSEGVENKPSFRAPIRRRRCLVPSSGFYEWRRLDGGTKSKPNKQPHFIYSQCRNVLAFAGLWEHWQSPDGEVIESFSILTTEANEFMRPLHHRMPVILSPPDYGLWLDPDVQDFAQIKPLLKPCPDDELAAHPVSKLVNSPTNDGPACIEAVI